MNYYRLLGIPENASLKHVRQVCRERANVIRKQKNLDPAEREKYLMYVKRAYSYIKHQIELFEWETKYQQMGLEVRIMESSVKESQERFNSRLENIEENQKIINYLQDIFDLDQIDIKNMIENADRLLNNKEEIDKNDPVFMKFKSKVEKDVNILTESIEVERKAFEVGKEAFEEGQKWFEKEVKIQKLDYSYLSKWTWLLAILLVFTTFFCLYFKNQSDILKKAGELQEVKGIITEKNEDGNEKNITYRNLETNQIFKINDAKKFWNLQNQDTILVKFYQYKSEYPDFVSVEKVEKQIFHFP